MTVSTVLELSLLHNLLDVLIFVDEVKRYLPLCLPLCLSVCLSVCLPVCICHIIQFIEAATENNTV